MIILCSTMFMISSPNFRLRSSGLPILTALIVLFYSQKYHFCDSFRSWRFFRSLRTSTFLMNGLGSVQCSEYSRKYSFSCRKRFSILFLENCCSAAKKLSMLGNMFVYISSSMSVLSDTMYRAALHRGLWAYILYPIP